MKTVLLVPQNLEGTFTEWWERKGQDDGHIDYVTDDLTGFLTALI
jgi:putative hydrolase of the HAD superfamily